MSATLKSTRLALFTMTLTLLSSMRAHETESERLEEPGLLTAVGLLKEGRNADVDEELIAAREEAATMKRPRMAN